TARLKQGPMPVDDGLRLAIDLADALTRAHKLDIIHRDLKPANVLLGDDGTLRLTDFGVAHLAQYERMTDTNLIIGTVDYLPPEAFIGEGIDRRADIWSFGVMLFEMLTGQRPFTASSALHLMQVIVIEPVPDLGRLRPDTPPALIDLVYRMLAKEPHERIGSVRQVGAELEAILDGTPIPHASSGGQPSAGFSTPPGLNLHTPLDPPPHRLVGREEKLAELRAKLAGGGHVLLHGLGGMGKTALAGTLAIEHRSTYGADALHWLKVVDAPVDRLLDDVWRAAHGSPLPPAEPLEARAARVRALLEGVPDLLVVLDDITLQPGQNASQTAAHRWQELVQPRGRPLLVTSRAELPRFTQVAVAELAPADARTLLLEQLTDKTRTRLQAHPDAVEALCQHVGRHALGLKLLGALIEEEFRSMPQAALADLPALEGVDAALRLSWDRLTADAHLLLTRLAALWGPSAGADLLRLCVPELDEAATYRALDDLERRSLLREVKGRYALHDLVRDYARRQRDEATAALAGCVAYTTAYSEQTIDHWDKLDAELDNLLGAVAYADRHDSYSEAHSLADDLWPKSLFLPVRSHLRRGIPVMQAGLRAARALGHSEGKWLNNLGVLYANLGQMDRALGQYEQAVTLFRAEGRRDREGRTLGNMGLAYWNLGQAEQAVVYFEQGLAILQELGDRRGEGITLMNLGLAYWSLGQAERAVDYYEQSLAILREADDRRGEGQVLHNLGEAYAELGQLNRAVEVYERSLAILRDMGDHKGEAQTLHNLGEAYARLGQIERAVAYYEPSLAILREVGDRRSEGYVLCSLADAYRLHGDLDRAAMFHEQARATAEEVADRRLMAEVLYTRGLLAADQGHLAEAAAHLEQARDLNAEIGRPHKVAACEEALQRLYSGH
ncbi:MAG: tetratricopeptide repeat protein, partial [Chloroflexi bacterium]|nr:tetratricopeptide repeat protein [Chloroflexota bacterium]